MTRTQREPLKNLYLFCKSGSRRNLQALVLTYANRAANIEKEIRELEHELGELHAGALVAELILAHGEELICLGSRTESSDNGQDEPLGLKADGTAALYRGNRRLGKAC